MYKIQPKENIKKEIGIPPDKSISHRALMISAIAKGKTVIKPFLKSNDTLITLECIQNLGVDAQLTNSGLLSVDGCAMYFPKKTQATLNTRESGTTMRLLAGMLSAQSFATEMRAAGSLTKRPMARVCIPLRKMNADIRGVLRNGEEYPPLVIRPVNGLRGITYCLSIPSAQVKSAILYASCYARGRTTIYEPVLSRDHTERMLRLFRANLNRKGRHIYSERSQLKAPDETIFIPADFSSATYFIVLGLLLKNSEILIRDVNINPTRCGLLRVLKRMGAHIFILNPKHYFEPYADILVKTSRLKATVVSEDEVPLLIDEVPILCVAASFAKGKTIIRGLRELKIKESDRLTAIINNLQKAGVEISAYAYSINGRRNWAIEIKGAKSFKNTHFKSFLDHRIAMSMVIMGCATLGNSTVSEIECIDKSFPEFITLFESL